MQDFIKQLEINLKKQSLRNDDFSQDMVVLIREEDSLSAINIEFIIKSKQLKFMNKYISSENIIYNVYDFNDVKKNYTESDIDCHCQTLTLPIDNNINVNYEEYFINEDIRMWKKIS